MSSQRLTLSCDSELQKLAITAMEIQDASNLIPVAGFFHKVCLELRARGLDSAGIRMHPITLTVLNKIRSMCDLPEEYLYYDFDCLANCDALAEGREAYWPETYAKLLQPKETANG